jgi:hypothetical protein
LVRLLVSAGPSGHVVGYSFPNFSTSEYLVVEDQSIARLPDVPKDEKYDIEMNCSQET